MRGADDLSDDGFREDFPVRFTRDLLAGATSSGRREMLPFEWIESTQQLRVRLRHFSTYELLLQYRRLLPFGPRFAGP